MLNCYLWKDSALDKWRDIYERCIGRMLAEGAIIGMEKRREKELRLLLKEAQSGERFWHHSINAYFLFRATDGYTAEVTLRINLVAETVVVKRKTKLVYSIKSDVNFPCFGSTPPAEVVRYGELLTRVGRVAVELETMASTMELDQDPEDKEKIKLQDARNSAWRIVHGLKKNTKTFFEELLRHALMKATYKFSTPLTRTEMRKLEELALAGLISYKKQRGHAPVITIRKMGITYAEAQRDRLNAS